MSMGECTYPSGRGFELSDCSAGLTVLTAKLYGWGFAKYAIKSSNDWRDHRLT